MHRKRVVKVLLWTGAFVVLIILALFTFFKPWAERKIQAVLVQAAPKYHLKIGNVEISFWKKSVALHHITICSGEDHRKVNAIDGEIESVKLSGISMATALFKNELEVNELTITNCTINGLFAIENDTFIPLVSNLKVEIKKILLDDVNVRIWDTMSSKVNALKGGKLNIYDFAVLEGETLSVELVHAFDFEASELTSVTPDSFYTYKAIGLAYAHATGLLRTDSIAIHPNYANYEFTSRHQFQSDRIEANFSKVDIHHFYALDYLKRESFLASYASIEKMDIRVFRDTRMPSKHTPSKMFQEMIYDYQSSVNIDSLLIAHGNVEYTEHAVKSNLPGSIRFDDIQAKIYCLTNDTTNKGKYLKLKSTAFLMGKGKLNIVLESPLFDSLNTFTVTGNLASMEASELNPMLSRNAYLYVSTGKVDGMNFSFTGDRNEAKGNLVLRYHNLDIAVKNIKTNDTIAIKERIQSFVTNRRILDSNPLRGKEVRNGIIYFARKPHHFIFFYCFKSIMSGVESTLAKKTLKVR